MDGITIEEKTAGEGMGAEMAVQEFENDFAEDVETTSDTVIESEESAPETGIEKAERLFNERRFEQAFDIYRQCAEDGDRLSKCRMGEMYYDGLGVDKRPLKAFGLIKESYDPDCMETVYQLGKCHFEGIGTSVDQARGFEMIISAAERGYPPAENYVAGLYLEGPYVEKDANRAMVWLRKAVEHEDPKALYNMANFLYNGNHVGMNQHKAMVMWKRSFQLHYPQALGKLGMAYMDDTDHRDTEKGLRCLEKAALLGDGDAAEILADSYVDGMDIKRDEGKAVEFFKLALRNGNKRVLYDLGMLHCHCPEIRNYKKACGYFMEGHENGDRRCSFEYAMMKFHGRGTDTDKELAFGILLKGAENGDKNCMGWVGHCYEDGIGVNPSKRLAREWFERGHEAGDSYCSYRLAWFYMYGVTVNRDEKHSLKLLRTSFEGGKNCAAFVLGKMYEKDTPFRSFQDAIYWYMAGAERNEADCMMKLAGHYESGEFISRSEEKAFELYKRAYKTEESPIAAAEIGRCFEDGVGTEADVKTAIGWYLKAARRNSFSAWRLYNIYIGMGETDRAIFWLRRSASKRSVSAMVELAKIYEEGLLIPKSDYKAMKWYHAASDEGNEFAKSRFEELIGQDPQDPDDLNEYETITRRIGEKGDDFAIMSLAESLMEGNGMAVDLLKARMWYDIAYQLGVRGAKDGLKKVDSLMNDNKQISSKQTTLD